MSQLASWLRIRRFSEPTFRPSGATNHWKNRVFRDFPTFSRICIFFLLTLLSSTLLSSNLSLLSASSLLCFSSVHIVGSLTSKLPSTTTTTSGSGSGSGSGGSRTSTSTSTSTCTCTCTSSTWRRGVGVTLIQTKQKRAAREQRNKYKPRTETKTTPSNQTRRQAGGFLQSSACSPEMPNCLFVKHGTCLPIPTATYRNYIIAIIYPFLGGERSCAKYNVPIDLIVRGHQAISDAAKIVDGVDKMITKYSSQPSEALQNTSKKTAITNSLWADLKGKGKTSRLMEAEMISGQAEGQLLQILLKLSGGNWAVRNWMVF